MDEPYVEIAMGAVKDKPWGIAATKSGALVVGVDTSVIVLRGPELSRFLEAVAQAVAPGQVTL